MSFHDWNGQTECRTFADFYQRIHGNPGKKEAIMEAKK